MRGAAEAERAGRREEPAGAGAGLVEGVRSALPLAVALTLSLCLPLPLSSQSVIRALEVELAADVVRDSVGSVAGAVFVGDEVVWRGAFGWSDRGSRALAGPRTIYRAGSLTKTVTALVLLRLVESDVVSLDDTVADHIPELLGLGGPGAAHARGITFRQLATHTAGLAREADAPEPGRGAFAEWKHRLVAAIPSTHAIDPPGRGYRYSNVGYGLLGFALERAAGRPFEILADSLVFRPLDMRSTSFVVPGADRRRLATGYVNLPGDTADPRVPRAEHGGRGFRVPSGGLYSTVDDLARLGMVLTGALPLIPDSLRDVMLARALRREGTGPIPSAPGMPGFLPDDRGSGYGLGVQLLDLGGVQLAGHSGTVPGYAAYLLVDREARTGVVLLRSYNRGATNLGAAATRLLLSLHRPDSEHRPDPGGGG